MTDDDDTGTPGRAAQIVRGVSRFLAKRGESCLTEFTLKTGRRVDVIALDRKGRITVVEVKSSVADFRSNQKWFEYLEYCDLFFHRRRGFPARDIAARLRHYLGRCLRRSDHTRIFRKYPERGAAQSRHASLRANQRQPIAWIYRSRLDSRIFLTVSGRIRYAVILPKIP